MKYRLWAIKHKAYWALRRSKNKAYWALRNIKRSISHALWHIKFTVMRNFSIMSNTQHRLSFRAFGVSVFYYKGRDRWHTPRISDLEVCHRKRIALGKMSVHI